MRAPTNQQEEFVTVFSPRRVAVVKVKCLLQAAITSMDKLPKNKVLPYCASLNVISDLFDSEYDKKAFVEICDFNYRLQHENHPCGAKVEGFVREMVETIVKSNLLAESDS